MSNRINTTTPPIEENMEQGWHNNTDLGCDVKTILRSDKRIRAGKEYWGMMRRDSDIIDDELLGRDPHYTFVEALPSTDGKRNPHIFVGKYITMTRRDDGSLRPNFKPLRIDADFDIGHYAESVRNELHSALSGLVGKE